MGDSFDGAGVLFNDVVQVFVLSHQDVNAGVSVHTFSGRCIGAAIIDCRLSIVIFLGTPWRLMARSRKRRAAALSRFGCQKKVNRIAGAINCPVKVLPLARDFDVGLIHAPTPTKVSLAPAKDGRHYR